MKKTRRQRKAENAPTKVCYARVRELAVVHDRMAKRRSLKKRGKLPKEPE